MCHNLFFTHTTAILAECWLQDKKPEAASVVLVCECDALEHARALREGYPSIKDVLSIDDVQPSENTHIILPLALDSVLLRYQYHVGMPRLAPHYALIHKIWQQGFRHFDVYSPQGEQSYRIPYLPDEFHNKHKGQRCFVVGNGPSLNQLDMGLLKNEITLGANRCYLGYEKWGFNFTYWGLYDQYQVEMHHAEYEQNIPADTVKFFPIEYLPLMNFTNACPVNINRSRAAHAFTPDPAGLHMGYTVSYMLLQIAALMGCNPIYLIGMDHRYDLKYDVFADALKRIRRWGIRQVRDTAIYEAAFALNQKRLKRMSQEEWQKTHALWGQGDTVQPTHFDTRYTAGDVKKFALPEPAEAERDFACAYDWAKKSGVQILNATPGSALEVFPKAEYKDLF